MARRSCPAAVDTAHRRSFRKSLVTNLPQSRRFSGTAVEIAATTRQENADTKQTFAFAVFNAVGPPRGHATKVLPKLVNGLIGERVLGEFPKERNQQMKIVAIVPHESPQE